MRCQTKHVVDLTVNLYASEAASLGKQRHNHAVHMRCSMKLDCSLVHLPGYGVSQLLSSIHFHVLRQPLESSTLWLSPQLP